MLYSVDTGSEITKIPHFRDYERWHSRLTDAEYNAIVLDLNNPLPLEEIYEKAVEEYTGYPDQEGLTETIAVNPTSVEKKQAEKLLPSETDATQILEAEKELHQVKKVELRHYGTELLTRDAGTAIRADVAGYLAAGYIVEVSLDEAFIPLTLQFFFAILLHNSDKGD